MSRRQNNPLRPLTDVERDALTRLSRATAAPAAQVTRARLLLAVADGANYQDAAHALGRKSGDGVATLVARFNALGLDALPLRHGGGRIVPGTTGAGEALVARPLVQKRIPCHSGKVYALSCNCGSAL